MLVEPRAGLLAVVNRVVVEYQMDHLRIRIGSSESIEQLDEQLAVLSIAFHADHLFTSRVQRAGEIMFLVFARRDDQSLRAGQHVIQSDAWIEIDVHLIFPQRHFVIGQVFDQVTNLPYSPFSFGFRPGTGRDRFGSTSTHTQRPEYSSQRTRTDLDSRQSSHLGDQQCMRPGGSAVAEVRRSEPQKVNQHAAEEVVDLAITVVLASIDQTRLAVIDEASNHASNRAWITIQMRSDLSRRHPVISAEHDQIPQPRVGIINFAKRTTKLPPLRTRQYNPFRFQRASFPIRSKQRKGCLFSKAGRIARNYLGDSYSTGYRLSSVAAILFFLMNNQVRYMMDELEGTSAYWGRA